MSYRSKTHMPISLQPVSPHAPNTGASGPRGHVHPCGPHGLLVHEWQLNVSPARVAPSIVSQPSDLRHHRSACDTFAKAFFHAANAFETRVATLLMYNAARVKRM
jgi:hypothetical protein